MIETMFAGAWRAVAALALTMGLLVPAGAAAQQPLGQPVDSVAVDAPGTRVAEGECPAADEADGRAIELRLGGTLIRAQVGEAAERPEADGPAGAGVEVRLIECEARGDAGGTADPDQAGAAGSPQPLLRLLHDLRIGVGLAATEDGECVEARFSIRDESPATAADPAVEADRPMAFRLCGLPAGVIDDEG